jgi:hypothetical protein
MRANMQQGAAIPPRRRACNNPRRQFISRDLSAPPRRSDKNAWR